ncbi:MAG TPA: hypothetical protein PKY05_12485, partial [Fibrobacteria bacterium]|nr:hypothetical protein [Fibrobacteria bacterium]
LHAIREAKAAKGIGMPIEQIADLPNLLKTYAMRWDRERAGLLFFSDPFKQGGKMWRWRVVFEPRFHPNGNRLVFKTITRVGEDDIRKGLMLR